MRAEGVKVGQSEGRMGRGRADDEVDVRVREVEVGGTGADDVDFDVGMGGVDDGSHLRQDVATGVGTDGQRGPR